MSDDILDLAREHLAWHPKEDPHGATCCHFARALLAAHEENERLKRSVAQARSLAADLGTGSDDGSLKRQVWCLLDAALRTT